MAKGKTSGILAGSVIGIFVIGVVAYSGLNYEDASLADINVTYFEERGGIVVALILKNADGEFAKANGHIEITIYNKKDNTPVYSGAFEFTKSDFSTWDNLVLGQQLGVGFAIEQRLPEGEYVAVADVQTKTGKYWEDLRGSFHSTE